jgi:hypothetical protein
MARTMTTVINVWLVAEIYDEDDESNSHDYDLDIISIADGNTPEEVFSELISNISNEQIVADIEDHLLGHIEQMKERIKQQCPKS